MRAARAGGRPPVSAGTAAIGGAARGLGGAVILAEEGGHGGGDLRLDDGRRSRRSPSAGVSGPMTAIQMFSEPFSSTPCSFHSLSPLPRP